MADVAGAVRRDLRNLRRAQQTARFKRLREYAALKGVTVVSLLLGGWLGSRK